MNYFSREFEAFLANLIEKTLDRKLGSYPLQGKKEIDPESDPYLTREAAAKYLKICLTTLHNYIKGGKIKSHRVGNRVLIKKVDLEVCISLTKYN